MADPVWGQLAKAQDNNQTIDQAIAAAIAVHEADPDAHTGAGESLETHKSQEVVDHPLGSILADKLTHTEHYSECTFESLDGWDITGDVTPDGWTSINLYIETGAVELSKISTLINWYGDYIDFAKDMLFQTTLWYDETSNKKAFFCLGTYTDDTTREGFGFEIINGVVKGWWVDSNGLEKTADLNINAGATHVWRAQYIAAEKKIYFYVDGVLKGTITDINIGDISFEGIIQVVNKTNGTTDGNLRIKNVIIARQA